MFEDKKVFITGGTGSIEMQYVNILMKINVKKFMPQLLIWIKSIRMIIS